MSEKVYCECCGWRIPGLFTAKGACCNKDHRISLNTKDPIPLNTVNKNFDCIYYFESPDIDLKREGVIQEIWENGLSEEELDRETRRRMSYSNNPS